MEKARKNEMVWIYIGIVLILVLFLYFLWFYYHPQIVRHSTYYAFIFLDYIDIFSIFEYWKYESYSLFCKSEVVTFKELFNFLNKVNYLFVIIPILFTIRGVKLANKHPANYSRRKIDISTLPHIISHHSPAIIPCLYYGDKHTLLLNVDPIEHKSSLAPEEWAIENQLIINGCLDMERCKKLFITDLGSEITSIDELSAIERALFSIFACRIFGSKEELKVSQELLDKLNRSCHFHTWQNKKGYPDLTLTDSTFKKYAYHLEVPCWIEKHTYSRTLLYSMHKAALKSGKLPSSHFRWLKGMDRALFYVLNTTGRKTPFIESAAVFTQALWEDFAFDRGIKLEEPAVQDAVIGLQNYLIKIGIITIAE